MKENTPETHLAEVGTVAVGEQREPHNDQTEEELQTTRAVRVTRVVVGAGVEEEVEEAAREVEVRGVEVVRGVELERGVEEGVELVDVEVETTAEEEVVEVEATAEEERVIVLSVELVEATVVVLARVVVVEVEVGATEATGSGLVAVGTNVPASPDRTAAYTLPSNPFESKTILNETERKSA